MIKTKRVYDPPAKNDGYRVLVDRIWPRGVSKKDADLEQWLKEIAPSDDLRKWFGHDPKNGRNFSVAIKKILKRKRTRSPC